MSTINSMGDAVSKKLDALNFDLNILKQTPPPTPNVSHNPPSPTAATPPRMHAPPSSWTDPSQAHPDPWSSKAADPWSDQTAPGRARITPNFGGPDLSAAPPTNSTSVGANSGPFDRNPTGQPRTVPHINIASPGSPLTGNLWAPEQARKTGNLILETGQLKAKRSARSSGLLTEILHTGTIGAGECATTL